jgi:putative ABC transport system substrate-binding protein
MRRREFITLASSAAIAWPLAAHAQQPAIPLVGFLSSTSAAARAGAVAAFHHGLGEGGYIEGRNVALAFRWAENQYDRLPGLAADLVQRRAAVIAYFGAVNGALAAKAATSTIPVVFVIGSDPVEFGLVTSLNRPGGNLTGVTLIIREMSPKRLEILRELLPGLSIVGLLVNPTNRNTDAEVREVENAASSLGVDLHVLNAGNKADIDAAFASLKHIKAGRFLTMSDASFTDHRDQIAELAARHAIPGIAQAREYVEAGGLMSYGSNQAEAYRLLGSYTARILKGEKPAELPVQQLTKVELVVNLKTAKVLGIDLPSTLLARADEVIE